MRNPNKKSTILFNFVSYFPILDKNSNLIDLIKLKREKKVKFKNQVVIFAGGMGKRLYPFTKTVPKPMLKIKNMTLVTRSKKKVVGLDGYGIKIVKQEILK